MGKHLLHLLLSCCLVVTASTGQAVERVTYYHNDALGSPVAATDAGGTLLWREEYQPYGSRIKREAGSRDTVWYTGKQEESATGLSYFGARWYDPAMGRFVAMDPAGFSPEHVASFSKYAYANNNPYVYVDPDGNVAETALDIVSFGLSLAMFKSDPSLANGLGLAYDGAAAVIPFLPAGFGIIKSAVRGVDEAVDVASNPANAVKLNKQLASEQQLGEVGVPVAGAGTKSALRDANRLANEYGGNASDWAKRSSTQHTATDGSKFETHWYENSVTGQRAEPKTIVGK